MRAHKLPDYDSMLLRILERGFGPNTATGRRFAWLITQRWFLLATTLGFVVFLVQGSLPSDQGIVGSVDGASSMVDMLLGAFVVFSIVLMPFAATAHAVINRVKVWRWLNFVVWPCSFVYAWRLYFGSERTNRSSS